MDRFKPFFLNEKRYLQNVQEVLFNLNGILDIQKLTCQVVNVLFKISTRINMSCPLHREILSTGTPRSFFLVRIGNFTNPKRFVLFHNSGKCIQQGFLSKMCLVLDSVRWVLPLCTQWPFGFTAVDCFILCTLFEILKF